MLRVGGAVSVGKQNSQSASLDFHGTGLENPRGKGPRNGGQRFCEKFHVSRCASLATVDCTVCQLQAMTDFGHF